MTGVIYLEEGCILRESVLAIRFSKFMYIIDITFTKLGLIRYISHLDLLRLFGRALRRANLPFMSSLGFNKRPEIKIKRALKLGIESVNEEAQFILKEEVTLESFKKRLEEELPEGIRINPVRERKVI